MEELTMNCIMVESIGDMAMLDAYRLTCEAAGRHYKFNGKSMSDEEWWAAMQDNFNGVLQNYKHFDIWSNSKKKHSEETGA